jgi:hypothetical protein
VIGGSIALIFVATGLLVAGLVKQSDPMFYGSIVSSALAAFAVIIGARQLAGTQSDEDDDFDLGPAAAAPTASLRADQEARAASLRADPPGSRGRARGQAQVTATPREPDDGDPPDEPPVQPVTAADAAIVARLDAPVRVIDGRPRYHREGCLHLLGRDSEALPVREAVEFGFTPCAQCEPDRNLVAEARRR